MKSIPGSRKAITHGTLSGYKYFKCTCELCKGAMLESARKCREKKRSGFVFVGPKPIKHGTPAAHAYHGCRCEVCVSFMKEYRSYYRLKRLARDGIVPRKPTEPKPPRKARELGPEKQRECGTAEAYSFGCTCELCLTQGFQYWIKEIAA